MPTEPPADDVEVMGQVITVLKRLDTEARKRVYDTVGIYFGLKPTADRLQTAIEPQPLEFRAEPVPTTPTFSADRAPAPKHFLLEKQPRTDVEKVACLAYYLTHYRETAQFTTLDISRLNTEAAQRKFANAAKAVNNAMQYGYLVPGSKGAKQISASGERYVEALPDHAAARDAMSSGRPRRKAKKNSNAKR